MAVNASASYRVQYSRQVTQLINQINTAEIWGNLTTLSQFPDRASNHDTGIKAANWINEYVETLIQRSGRKDAVVYTVATNGTDFMTQTSYSIKQPSIVLKIGNTSEAGIVVGAHFDTVSCEEEGCINDTYGSLPGVDDNGSGTVVLLELAKVLLSCNMNFKKPIYLIWYAAEENGELGSQSVVNEFVDKHISISAVMNLDQVGYEKDNDPTMWIFDGSENDPELVSYMTTLIDYYIKLPIKYAHRNGDSDGWIWHHAGFKAIRPVENDAQSPYTHKSVDKLENVSLSHMTNYLKLALAFIVELSEPVG